MLRLAFHFNNHSSLGHAVVTYSLVKSLKSYYNDKVKIVVIEDGMIRSDALPFSKYGRLYFCKQNSGDINKIKKKIIITKSILDNFKPDILITEYFPFNRNLAQRYAFPHILEYLKKRFHTKIISNCTFPNWSNDTYDLIKSFYDLVLFHLPERLFHDCRNYLPQVRIGGLDAILRQFSKKIFFTGFLFDKGLKTNVSNNVLIRKKLGLSGNKKLIVVSRGGRTEYKKLIIYSLLLAKKYQDWFFLISTGPSVASEDYREFQKIASSIDNVKLAKFIYPDFDSYLRASDLSVNMAGYNTIARLLWYRKKTILFPIANTEQIFNARILNSLMTSEIVTEKELNLNILEHKAEHLLKTSLVLRKTIEKDWFNGLAMTTRIIRESF